MRILICNAGSTSLKLKLYTMPAEELLCSAYIERVGSKTDAILSYRRETDGAQSRVENMCIPDYTTGLQLFFAKMLSQTCGVLQDVAAIDAVGFKTVVAKGYNGIHLLDADVMEAMRAYLFIAPVHNSAYISVIEQCRELLPRIPLVGAFETAFHTTIPDSRSLYAVPYTWYEKYGVKRLGYHGASHSHVAREARRLGVADRLISCHLGGSCSVCAIEKGKSVDTSFGFSLQTGIPHSSRTGDADPYLVPFLQNEGMPIQQIMDGMGKEGGLLGLSGVSSDMRAVLEAAGAGNARAALAIEAFTHSIIHYIGAFYAELGGLDQLVFTGGIGERSAEIRRRICGPLRHMGIELDAARNTGRKEGVISPDHAKVQVAVIPANEELGIAYSVYTYLGGKD